MTDQETLQVDVPVIVLTGPTAIGKTALSFAIAAEFDCEIISMDSMQVYRYMDIGTAKPTRDEQRQFRHHLIDIINPDEQYNAARFVEDCLVAIQKISRQGRVPLITGGTGLYLSSLINGLFNIIKVSDDVKERLDRMLQLHGPNGLYSELCRVDPISAARIHKNDRQRIRRGLEIFFSTGVPWSSHIQEQKNKKPMVRFSRLFAACLTCPRERLYKRIERRTGIMLAQGLIEEVEKLRKLGYGAGLNSMQSIGYRHANQVIDRTWGLEEMKSYLIRDTRRYAKRQMTWFRRQNFLHWYNRGEQDAILHGISRKIMKTGRNN